MPVEDATYIPELDPSNPPGTDFVLEGDNHIRLQKQVLQNQFPGLAAAGVVNAGEDPTPSDETLSGASNLQLWSPKAVADFIKFYWDSWGLVTQTGISFRATHIFGANSSIPRNTPEKIQWEVVANGWDTNGWFDANNHRYTVQQAGIYSVHGRPGRFDPNSTANAGDEWFTYIRKNGVDYHTNLQNCPQQDELKSVFCQGLVEMDVGDYVEIWCKHDFPEPEQVGGPVEFTTFEVFRIGDKAA